MTRFNKSCTSFFVLFLLCYLPSLHSQEKPENSGSLNENKGGVVLTFDDRNFDGWVKALPLFEEFGVKATFFIHGKIDQKALNAIKKIRSHHHAIGSHSVHHLKAVEYLKERTEKEYLENEILPQMKQFQSNGIKVSSFAYPMSRNDQATDDLLLKQFRHLRTGGKITEGKTLSEDDAFFVKVSEISRHGCLTGKGIDYAPTRADRTFEQLDAALERAARNQEILILYAHNIAESSKGHHITPEALTRIFLKAKELDLKFYTFDELP